VKKYTFLILGAVPSIANAENIGDVVYSLNGALGYIVPIIIGFALIAFLWGILKYLVSGSDEKQREESKMFMLWGIIGLAVMVSVWGLVSILANLFGMHIPSGISPSLPDKQ
jgi:uncharacterized membrane protein YidH (DUF202 family)